MKQKQKDKQQYKLSTVRITYIGHSGFLVETENRCLLFDYYEGKIPRLPEEKPLFIFVSHRHGDHFNPAVFELSKTHPMVHYILAYDIKLNAYNCNKWKISQAIQEHIFTVKANEVYFLEDMEISTLKSTDEGVAFLVHTEGMRIYHAGDLNLWYWKGESKQWNHNMIANFKKEINQLTDVPIDIAFLPLDPRQEEEYSRGLLYMLEHVNMGTIFPMHMWKKYDTVLKFKKENLCHCQNSNIIEVKEEGQMWTIDLGREKE